MQALVCTGGLGLLKQSGSMKVVYIAILNSLVLFQGLTGGVVPQGGEYPLVSGFSGHQSSPDLILWSEGGLLAWENTTGEGIKRIVVQSINSEGKAAGDAQVISQNIEGIHDTDPDIEVLDDQRAVLVWSSGRRGQTQIYMAIVNRTGSRVGGMQKVSQKAKVILFLLLGCPVMEITLWHGNRMGGMETGREFTDVYMEKRRRPVGQNSFLVNRPPVIKRVQ